MGIVADDPADTGQDPAVWNGLDLVLDRQQSAEP